MIENSMMKAVNDGNGKKSAQLVDKFVNSLYNRKPSHDRSFSSTGWWYPCCRCCLAGLSANQIFKERSEDVFSKLNDFLNGIS